MIQTNRMEIPVPCHHCQTTQHRFQTHRYRSIPYRSRRWVIVGLTSGTFLRLDLGSLVGKLETHTPLS